MTVPPRLAKLLGLIPLTPAGALMLFVGTAAGLLVGVGRRDVVLVTSGLAVGALGLLLLVPVVVATASIRRPRAGRPRTPLVLESGVAQATGFALSLPRLLPLVEVGWSWEEPPGFGVDVERDRAGATERVRPSRRGLHLRVVRRLTVKDALGLTGVSLFRAEETEIRVLPSRGALDQRLLLEALAGGEEHADPRGEPAGDYVEMRQYAPGDSPRLILWKVYARTRKLLVRVPERAVTARPRTCAYLVAGDGDEAAAGLARLLVERDVLGAFWRFGADGSAGYASTLDDALDRVARSGGVPPGRPTGLAPFLAQAELDGFAACLVVVPARPGPWVEAVAAATRSPLRLRLLTAVDGVPGPRPAAARRLERLLVLPREDEGVPPEALALLAARLAGVPLPLTAVDRSSGVLLGDPRGTA